MPETYTRKALSNESGLNYRIIAFYTIEGLLSATGGGMGRGNHRVYDEKELKKAKLLKVINESGILLSTARDIVKRFVDEGMPDSFSFETIGCTFTFRIGK